VQRNLAYKGFALCTGLLIGLAASEVILRLTGATVLPLNFASGTARVPFPDSPKGYFRFSTNSLAYRSAELPRSKAPEAFRVVVLGDSQTNGMGVDDPDRFSDRLERPLSRILGDRVVQVMNFSRAGTTIPEYLLDLGKSIPFHPDVALCAVYSGNDLAGMVPYLGAGTVVVGPAPTLRDALLFVPRKLYAYHLAEYSIRKLKSWVVPPSMRPLEEQEPFTQALGQVSYFVRHPDERPVAVARAGTFLGAIARECRRAGMRLVVLIIPSKLQVEPELARPAGAGPAARLGLKWEDAIAADRSIHDALVEAARGVAPGALDLADALRHAAVTAALLEKFRAAPPLPPR